MAAARKIQRTPLAFWPANATLGSLFGSHYRRAGLTIGELASSAKVAPYDSQLHNLEGTQGLVLMGLLYGYPVESTMAILISDNFSDSEAYSDEDSRQ